MPQVFIHFWTLDVSLSRKHRDHAEHHIHLQKFMALLLSPSPRGALRTAVAILKSKSFTVHPPWNLELCRGAGLEKWGITQTTEQVNCTKLSRIKRIEFKLFKQVFYTLRNFVIWQKRTLQHCVYSPRIWYCGCPFLCASKGVIEAEWY